MIQKKYGFVLVSICCLFVSSVYATNTTKATEGEKVSKISNIQFTDDKNFSLMLENVSDVDTKNSSDIKILEDMGVKNITINPENKKKILIEGNQTLQPGVYSVISISDNVDASIDFTVGENNSLSNNTNQNISADTLGIESVSSLSGTQLEITLNKEAGEDNSDFKVFKNIKTDSFAFSGSNLNVKIGDSLKGSKEYIMILSLKDTQGKEIIIENSLYDFSTPDFSILKAVESSTGEKNIEATTETETPAPTETPITETSTNITPVSEVPVGTNATDSSTSSGELLTNSASGETISGSGELKNIETVAMSANKTPDTGTKTNILLFLVFLSTGIIFMMRRKKINY